MFLKETRIVKRNDDADDAYKEIQVPNNHPFEKRRNNLMGDYVHFSHDLCPTKS